MHFVARRLRYLHSRGLLALVTSLVFTAAPLALAAQAPDRTNAPSRPAPVPNATERRTRPGPWDSDVLVHRVTTDGRTEKLATFERAGVPTLSRLKDGRLIAAHQHFPENDDDDGFDKVAVRFSSDEGRTWSAAKVIQLAGLPDGLRFPFDPTLVPLPDGRVRLYFTSVQGRTFEQSTPAIYSAVSSDGLRYTVEPGVRFGVEGRIVIDCAVVLHNGRFHLYAPDNGPAGKKAGPRDPGVENEAVKPEDRPREGVGYHATSQDGLSFTREPDVQIEGRRRWLGNAQSDGKLITFYGTGNPGRPGQPGGAVWLGTSDDGQRWRLLEAQARIPGADPGAVSLRDGSLLVAATGGPRPGTASAERGLENSGRPDRARRENPSPEFQPRIPPLIQALDLNGDGEISAGEIEKAPDSLRKADQNKDGKLSGEELRLPRVR